MFSESQMTLGVDFRRWCFSSWSEDGLWSGPAHSSRQLTHLFGSRCSNWTREVVRSLYFQELLKCIRIYQWSQFPLSLIHKTKSYSTTQNQTHKSAQMLHNKQLQNWNEVTVLTCFVYLYKNSLDLIISSSVIDCSKHCAVQINMNRSGF